MLLNVGNNNELYVLYGVSKSQFNGRTVLHIGAKPKYLSVTC